MASIDRYRPVRESYQPPSLPPKPPPPTDRSSRSPTRRQNVPPAVPSPPTLGSRSPPSRQAASKPVPPSPAHPVQQPPVPIAKPWPSQWLFTSEEILSSPSIIDGLSPAEERFRRAKGVNFIYQAGIMLELPQITLWVASVFFHRFFMRVSLVEGKDKNGVHHYNIAATALFLANKTQEDCRKTKDLIISVARVAQKNKNLIIDEQSKEYWRWRDSILMYEEIMLELLTFDLMVEAPYHQLYDYLKQLNLHHKGSIREAAWAYCNDATYSTLSLLMPHTEIAASAIFFAVAFHSAPIDDVDGQPWWRHLKVDEQSIIKATDFMSSFYQENPLQMKDDRYQSSPIFILESTRRTSRMLLGQSPQGENGSTPLNASGGGETDQGGSPLPAKSGGDVESKQNPNGKTSNADEDLVAQKQEEKGDSDAVLKAAANDLSRHSGQPPVDGGAAVSPGIKREAEQVPDSEPEPKRLKTSAEEDEGEVRES